MTSARIAHPALGESFLLPPGPLTTSEATRRAMLRHWGRWDDDSRAMTRDMRARLLTMLGLFIPRDGKALVLANGAYGQRSAEAIRYLGRDVKLLGKGDYLPPRGEEVAQILADDPAITHVVAIHCETSSGILNPVEEISEVTYAAGRKLLIDSMSACGALPLMAAQQVLCSRSHFERLSKW